VGLRDALGAHYGTFQLRGTRDTPPPGIEGECEPTNEVLTTPELELPAMSIGTTPSPPRDAGLGGVVNVDTWFWVEGYGGGGEAGPVVSASVFNCVVDRSDPESPRWQRVQADTHTLQVAYRGAGAPTWYWGDDMPTLSGWGSRTRPDVPHTYRVSSGRCTLGTCLDVPDKGPSYVIRFDLNLSLELITDSAPTAVPFPTSRHRAFPVREVQSVLEH
jgi:hypothetical protein